MWNVWTEALAVGFFFRGRAKVIRYSVNITLVSSQWNSCPGNNCHPSIGQSYTYVFLQKRIRGKFEKAWIKGECWLRLFLLLGYEIQFRSTCSIPKNYLWASGIAQHEKLDLYKFAHGKYGAKKVQTTIKCMKDKDGNYPFCPRIYNPM